ncbi:MAG: Na(+)/H(+) antiporter subunit D [Deltaproteobacteria bacterium]|nr:Na(+)/H(+) antiporter subunit D [Deltaproteobacteria bacterium]
MPSLFPPALLFIFAGFVIPLLKGRARDGFILLVPILGFFQIVGLSQSMGTFWQVPFLDTYNLVLLKVEPLRLCFAYVFTIIAFTSSLYAIHIKKAAQHVAAFIYIGSALGVVFAGDYFTLFVYWELMAVGSTAVILCRKSRAARESAYRYVLVHIAGGALLMAGIVLQLAETGSIAVVTPEPGWPFYLILLGFCLNAAVPPLSAWLPDAYPEASVTGAVYLTTYTTKTAVFVLALVFAGTEELVWAGAIMTLYGVVFATMENDIRRLLAYHIISQVGYMVCAVGLGTELAINGASAHAFSHILYKALLFMGTGAVIQATGRRQMSELGGIVKRMRWVFICYMVAGFSISGVPLFNGFISKSMIISAAGEMHNVIIGGMLVLASVGTFFSTTLKLPYYTFLGPENDEIKVDPLPKNMLWAMGIVAFLCFLFGIQPGLLYQLLPYECNYHPYTPDHIVDSLQILTACGIAFWIAAKWLGGHRTVTLDTDWFYRTASNGIYQLSANTLTRAGAWLEHVAAELVSAATVLVRRPDAGKGAPVKHTMTAAISDSGLRDSIGLAIGLATLIAIMYILMYFGDGLM